MLNALKLDRLKESHLLLLQKHIELGREHLKSLLSKEGIEELCSLDLINSGAEKKIQASATELAGTLTLPFNSVLTATLGAWIGLNGFRGLFLTSKLLFQAVMALSLSIGAVVGVMNYRFTKKEVRKRMEERELQDIQIYILDFLNGKRIQEITEKTGELNGLLRMIQITQSNEVESVPNNEFNNHQACLGWLQRLEHLIDERREKVDPTIYAIFTDEIEAVKKTITESVTSRDLAPPNKKSILPLLHTLIHAPLPPPKKPRSWIRMNWKQLFISVIPTLYGSFSSVFVYLNGAPKITREVGWEEMHSFLVDPRMKTIELTLAILTTLYFAFSFVSSNRKRFHRDQEIARAQEEIIKKQGSLSVLDDKLLKVKEALLAIQRVAGVFKVLKKLLRLENGLSA